MKTNGGQTTGAVTRHNGNVQGSRVLDVVH